MSLFSVNPAAAVSAGPELAVPLEQETSRPKVAAPRLINSSTRIPALDGLRGWAILLVLMFHSVFTRMNVHTPVYKSILRLGALTWSGVDLFFVLSGFLIGGILLDARESPNYFKTFYFRRAYRILPLYLSLLCLCWLAYHAGIYGLAPASWAGVFRGPVPWWTFFTFTQNIWMAVAGHFTGGGLGVTWSLAVEEQFYLTLPLVVWSVSRKRLWHVALAIVIGTALFRVLLTYFSPMRGPDFYGVLRVDGLGLGVLSALLVREPRSWNYLVSHRRLLYFCSSALLVAVLLIDLVSYPGSTVSLYGLQFSVLDLFYTSALLTAVTAEDRFVRATLCNRPLMKLGIISYGTYLLHALCLDIVREIPPSAHLPMTALITNGAMLVGVGMAILLAALSWNYFEKPLVRRGRVYTY